MQTQTLQAEVREGRGKGPARRLRAQGKIPAVFYGPGVEPTPLTVSPVELVRTLQGERGRNVVFALSIKGAEGAPLREELAMIRELATDPVSLEVLHADFYRVDETRRVLVEIPFSTEGRAIGVVKGGLLHVTARSVPIETTPDKIPTAIIHDVRALDIHQTVTAADLELPEGVKILLPPKRTLATILEDKRAAAAAEGEEGPPGKK